MPVINLYFRPCLFFPEKLDDIFGTMLIYEDFRKYKYPKHRYPLFYLLIKILYLQLRMVVMNYLNEPE